MTDTTIALIDYIRKIGMDNDVDFLREGLRILSHPQPGEAFDNENIAFVYAKQGLNIELIDTEKRAGLLVSD